MCVHLADTHLIALPPSPTSPSPPQASSPALMLYMAKLVMLSFPIVNLAHITSRFFIAFRHTPMACPTSSPPLHTRVDAGGAVSTGHHFPLDRCALSMDDRAEQITVHVHNASNSRCDSNPNPSQTHQLHCECCYDYTPSGVARLLSWPCSRSSSRATTPQTLLK